MFFLGCHLIDLIYQIQGEPCEVIPYSCSTGIDGVSTKDLGMVVYKYPNGISFAKACDNEMGGYMRRQLVICGEKGTIEIRPLEHVQSTGLLITTSNECYEDNWYKPWSSDTAQPYDRYIDMMQNFAELVRGKENPYTYDYELGLYKLILKSCGEEI